MRIYVNGKETDIADNLTIEKLVTEKGLNPDAVVVEHNLVITPNEKWSQFVLAEEDKLEIISFVGGG